MTNSMKGPKSNFGNVELVGSLAEVIDNQGLVKSFTFRDRRYQMRPHADGMGMVPGGVLHWAGGSADEQLRGLAFVVRDRSGVPINLLHLSANWQEDSTQTFLLGESLWGGRIAFSGVADPGAPTIFIDDWKEALLLSRRTGWTAIACLSLENLPLIARHWADDNPDRELLICFNGTADESDNPQLRSAYDVFLHRPVPPPAGPAHLANRTDTGPKKMRVVEMAKKLIEHRAWLIPSGPNQTFNSIDATGGEQGLIDHLKNQRTANQPWPLKGLHSKLDIVPLPLPWPAPLNGKALLERLQLALARYVVLSDRSSLVIAVWVFMTYATAAFRHLPILAMTSPDYGCGKSTLLSLLQFLCRRALGMWGNDFASVSRGGNAKNLKHLYVNHGETLLIDEAQTVFSHAQALQRLLMSFDSFELGIVTAEQEELVRHKRRGASALAYRDRQLPGRLASRCVHIDLQRQLPDERLNGREDLFTENELGELTLLRSCIRRWAADNLERLSSRPAPSLGLANPRLDDVWRPLLQVGFAIDEATGKALLANASDFIFETEEASLGKELLANLEEVVAQVSSLVINSTELCAKLCDNPEWPWRTRALNPTALARLLRPYDIRPSGPSRIQGKTLRSYGRQDIVKAVQRYLSPKLSQ